MYLLDANVYITAYRQYYQFNLVPGFWVYLAQQAKAARIRTIDRVRDEILHRNDKLSDWMRTLSADHFESCDRPEVVYEYQKLQKWAQTQTQFKDSARSEFATVADAWLIAHAKACGHTVVTHERYSADSKKSIKIPNVCKTFSIPCDEPFNMLTVMGAKFT